MAGKPKPYFDRCRDIKKGIEMAERDIIPATNADCDEWIDDADGIDRPPEGCKFPSEVALHRIRCLIARVTQVEKLALNMDKTIGLLRRLAGKGRSHD